MTRILCSLVSKRFEYKSHAISSSHLGTNSPNQPFVHRVANYIRQVSGGNVNAKQDIDDESVSEEQKDSSHVVKQCNAQRFS